MSALNWVAKAIDHLQINNSIVLNARTHAGIDDAFNNDTYTAVLKRIADGFQVKSDDKYDDEHDFVRAEHRHDMYVDADENDDENDHDC